MKMGDGPFELRVNVDGLSPIFMGFEISSCW